jgi:hypothetical protein
MLYVLNRFFTEDTAAMEEFFKAIQQKESKQLLADAESFAKREKKATAMVIAHIAEISKRKLALDLGYRSLFDYCEKRLNISSGGVWQRIQVANVCNRFPEVLKSLAQGEINLTAASKISPHLSKDNVLALIDKAKNLSTRELEEYLVTLQPKATFAPSVRKQPQLILASEKIPDTKAIDATDPVTATALKDPAPIILEPATSKRYNLRLSISKELKEKIDRLAEVMGFSNPSANLEEIFDLAITTTLEKKDPKIIQQRRDARQQKKAEEKPSVPKGEDSNSNVKGRYIPAEVKGLVLKRAGYRCEWVGEDQKRCSQRACLEIDHVQPFALGGKSHPDNLQILCRLHNLRKAEIDYGEELMQRKILFAQGNRRG